MTFFPVCSTNSFPPNHFISIHSFVAIHDIAIISKESRVSLHQQRQRSAIMLCRLGRIQIPHSRLLFRAAGPFSGSVSNPFRLLAVSPCRSFADATVTDPNSAQKPDNAFTPKGAAFSNPDISSDWVYREEEDTGRKYYINTKTNEVIYNRTPNSMLAVRWRRVVAGCIDGSIALGGGLIVSYLAGLELGDPNLGYVVGRIYAMLFFCGKDCFVDHCTRSIGKKIMKLEVVNKHGELSGLYRNFFRNTLELLTVITPFLGMPIFMASGLLTVLDGTLFLLFKKRVFDFLLGTRIVPEGADHKMRVKLYKDKLDYKKQSDMMEEASMSGMQQMIKQQEQYNNTLAQMEEMKKEKK